MLGSAGVGEISLEGVAFAACGVDGCGCVVGGAAVAVARYGGSGLRERGGNGGAKTAGCAGDKGYFVVEAEELEGVRLCV